MRLPTVPLYDAVLSPIITPLLAPLLAPARTAVEPARAAVAERIATTLRGPDTGEGPTLEESFGLPVGDQGLFGPDSMVWRVHSDVPGMLVGGISALLLQTLHPLAMAGVAEHSDFKERPLGRLQRTAGFIGTTTFGPTAAADEAIAVVRAVHTRVNGVAPDGRPYDANDPDLLTWVHSAEIGSCLRGYQRYSGSPLSDTEQDQYIDEVATVAEKLGARDVPHSSEELRAYFRRMRPELRGGEQPDDTVAFLMQANGKRLEEKAIYGLIMQGAIDLLPGWGRDMLGLRQLPVVSPLMIRPAAFALLGTLRWVLGPAPVRDVAAARALTPAA